MFLITARQISLVRTFLIGVSRSKSPNQGQTSPSPRDAKKKKYPEELRTVLLSDKNCVLFLKIFALILGEQSRI